MVRRPLFRYGLSWKGFLVRAAFLLLAGGSLLATSCQTRFRAAVVDGLENYVFSLLDPSQLLEELESTQ